MLRRNFRVYASALALTAAAWLSGSDSARGQAAPPTTVFAPQAVGSLSSPQPVTLRVRMDGTASTLSLASAEAASDFKIVAGGTCNAKTTYAAGDTCTAEVVFAPVHPGSASGAVLLRGTDGHLLGAARLRGTAVGSAVAFNPGLITFFALDAPAAHGFSAITSAGADVYLADASNGKILRLDPLTGITSSITTVLPVSDPVTAMAADLDGTMFFAQASGTVSRFDPATAAFAHIDLSNAAGAASAVLTAMAVDREGRLLIAHGARVLRLQNGAWSTLAGTSACADPTAACGDGSAAPQASFNRIQAIAVDAAGNLLVADGVESRVRRIDVNTGLVSTVAGTGFACTHGSCGDQGLASAAALGSISSMVVDSLGDLYLAEQGSGLRRIDANTGAINAVLPTSETHLRSGPVQIAALHDGTVLLLEQADPTRLRRFTSATAALSFAETAVGQTSTDSVQTITVSNLGNAPLALATPAAGTNPSTTADFPFGTTQSCPQLSSSSASQSLAPGASCSLQIKFTPTSPGAIAGRVVLSELPTAPPLTQNLAAAPAQTVAVPALHYVTVQGTAPGPTTQANIALVTLPNAPVYGQPISIYATVYSPTNTGPAPTGTVSFYEGSNTLAANVPLSGGNANTTVTLPSTDTHTYAVSYSGDSNYAASAQNSTISVTVARAASVFTVDLPTYQYRQDIRSAYVLSGQYSGTGISLPTGVVSYTLLDSSGNVLVTGISNHANRVNSIDENAPLGVLEAGSYTLRLSYPGDTNFLPLQQDFPLTVQPLKQTITFEPIESPIFYGTPPIPLSATATAGTPIAPSGLPVSFSVLSGPGSIVNGQLVVTGVGSIIVAADQPGNVDYYAAPRVTQTVVSQRPVVSLAWATPAPIVVGTPLSGAQLNASATGSNGQQLAGTFTYTPAAGAVLPVGSNTLNVTFVPADTEHYGTNPVTASVTLTVRDLTTPAIAFAGGSVAYGNGLAPVLNAAATANGAAVPGTFVYTSGASTLTSGTNLPVGSYSVTATFTPSDGNNYRGGSATATIVVNKGNVTLALTSSASPVLLHTTVTFTAKIKGGTAPPGGTVQFNIGSASLGSATLDGNGAAAVTTDTLPAGSGTVTATFNADGNYNGASATMTEVVADFTLALAANASNTQSVLPGKVATYQFTLAPTVTTALVSDVTFSISGLPSGATYTVTPSTVSSGSASTGITLAVTTPSALKSRAERLPWRGPSSVALAALLLMPFASKLRLGRAQTGRFGVLATLLIVSVVLLSAGGCGTGVGYFDQTALTSNVTLSANSGSLSHTAAVTLEIQ